LIILASKITFSNYLRDFLTVAIFFCDLGVFVLALDFDTLPSFFVIFPLLLAARDALALIFCCSFCSSISFFALLSLFLSAFFVP